MARHDRSTLKRFFRQGALPSADQFGDFIESTVNQVDDGFDKTPDDGLKIASLDPNDRLVSFYRGSVATDPSWTIGYDKQQDRLLFEKVDAEGERATVLGLSPHGRLGVNVREPTVALDVDGVVRAGGRLGTDDADRPVPADGRWHAITDTLEGCHALEIVAGVGVPRSGRYALMHAVALNAFNPEGLFGSVFSRRKKPIRCQHACYGARRDRLELRWAARAGRSYCLELRARCGYGDGIDIGYHVTRLWFDATMEGARSPAGAGGSGGPEES